MKTFVYQRKSHARNVFVDRITQAADTLRDNPEAQGLILCIQKETGRFEQHLVFNFVCVCFVY
jgi:hypothetical protein